MLIIALAVAAANPSVTFEIKPGGDVKWKGAPQGCTVDVFPSTAAEPIVNDADATKPLLELAPGSYDAVVACDSDEGLVKKTVALVLKEDRDVAVPVALEPGFLLVNVSRHDTPIAATITIFDERGREVAESKDKAVIPLVPGKVRVLAKVNDTRSSRVVFGNAQATIVTKQKATAQVDTTDGSLVVNITDNGRKTGGVAALRQPGQKTRLIELRAGEKGDAPPGTYDLVTQLEDTHDFSEVVTKNVVIAPGKAATKTVNHSTALIRPTVLVEGKKPAADAKIDVELSTPGATAPFNTAAVGDALKVASGTFEIAAVRKDAAFDDGTPPRVAQKVTVRGGEVRGVVLDVAAGHLDVTTTVGGKPRALDVVLEAPGNDVPLGRKTSAALDGKTSFALSAGKYIVKAVLKAPQGDVVTTQNASVAIGSHIGVKLNIDVGTAVVQVFEAGVAVPAEVRLFKSEAMKPRKSSKGVILLEPTGDPMVAAAAGQELFVPPGAYAIVVVRRGDIHVFSDLKVAAGRNVDRTVEIK